MSTSSSCQTDPVRSPDGQRAGEMLLSSSVASSVNSLASHHSVASLQGYNQQVPRDGLPHMLPPSYRSQPPSYGSYMQFPGPALGHQIQNTHRHRVPSHQLNNTDPGRTQQQPMQA